jgi:hypothetical protein
MVATHITARRFGRIFARIPVTLLLDPQNRMVLHDTVTIDLSARGARVRAKVPLWPGQKVEVMPTTDPKYAVPSRVIWVRANATDSRGEAGLEFMEPLPVMG